MIVLDSASGGINQAALSWHLDGAFRHEGDDLVSGSAKLTLPAEAWPTVRLQRGDTTTSLVYHAPASGQLELATTLLAGPQSKAQNESETLRDAKTGTTRGRYVMVKGDELAIEWLFNATAALEAHGLYTDGQMVSLVNQISTGKTFLCYVGGTKRQVPLDSAPTSVLDVKGQRALAQGRDWTYTDGRLIVFDAPAGLSACVQIVQ